MEAVYFLFFVIMVVVAVIFFWIVEVDTRRPVTPSKAARLNNGAFSRSVANFYRTGQAKPAKATYVSWKWRPMPKRVPASRLARLKIA